MSDMQTIGQRLIAIERDVAFLAQMVGLVLVDQATRGDVARLAEIGDRLHLYDAVMPPDEPEPPHDDLSTPTRPA